MRIPEAQDNVRKIAPNVGGIQPIAPIAAETDSAKAGLAMKESLQNAMEGFTKLYAADQRADAIKNFNDYKLALEEYRDSAQIDPTTGQPVGFTQLKGDQVTEDALKSAQDKVQAARAKLDKSISGFIPDLRDEFGMRADEAQASFDTATNAHFLKAKYEKAKTAAELDNDAIITNTDIGMNNTAQLDKAKASIKQNFLTYLVDEKAAERQAKIACEKIIQNNVIRMKRDGDPISYDRIRNMLHFYQKKGYLSETSEDALLHDIDLESANWKFNQLDTTEEAMAAYLSKNTKNLSAQEISEFIMKAKKRDITNARSGSSKNVSKMSDLLDWVTTRQAKDFSDANEYGFNFELGPNKYENVPELEASRFRSDFLSFANEVFSSINVTNQEQLEKKGLSGVLTESQISRYTNPTDKSYRGRMMKMAYRKLDDMFKNGFLTGLNRQEISEIKTKINNIREGNADYDARQQEYRAVTDQVSKLLDKKDAYTQEDINNGMLLYNQLSQFKGTDVAQNGDKSFNDMERHLADMLSDQIRVKNIDNNSLIGRIKGFFPKLWKKSENVVFSVDDWFKSGNDYVTSNRHHKLISDFADVAYSDGKRADGSISPLQMMYKEASDMLWENEEGKGLTLIKLNDDGSLDINGPKVVQKISFNDTINPDGSVSNIEKDFIRAQAQFGNYLNNKYKTSIYTDFNKIDAKKLTPEEKQVLLNLTRQEMLKGAGKAGYTYMPVNPMPEPSGAYGSFLGMGENQYTPEAEYERQLANIPPIGSFNGDLSAIKPSAFNGGAASSEDVVKFVAEGYTSFEDYAYEIDKNRPEQFFSPQEHINLILNAVTPYGINTITTPEKAYLGMFANDLVGKLSKENPGMKPNDFLKPDTFGYELSNETYEWAVKRYESVRRKQLMDLRDSFMRGESLERMKKYDMGAK